MDPGLISMERRLIHIENERLLIRSLEQQDLQALRAMRDEQRVYRYEPMFLAERQGTPEEALGALCGMDLEKDRQCILGVYEKTERSGFAGLAEFYDYKPSGKVISIGCRFLPERWGRGLATCCTRALLEFLRNNTEVELVTAHVLKANQASPRCLIKNGFEYLLTQKEDWGNGQMSLADVYTFKLAGFPDRLVITERLL